MTDQEFADSLSPQQTKYFNARLISIRDEYHAIYETNAANLVEAKAEDLKRLADQITSDAAEKTKLVEDNTKAIKELTDKHTDLVNSKIDEISVLIGRVEGLLEKIADLEQYRPFNPRIIDASKFYERISKDEFVALSVSDDETLRTIAKTIVAYKDNDWPVIFESPEMVGMLAYLVGTGFLTEERKTELVADASQVEAYQAD